MDNNLRLVVSIVASLEDAPILDSATRFKDLDTDPFTLAILVCANTAMTDGMLRDDDLAVCATLGGFARLMADAGHDVTDAEIAANAAADAADDNDIVLRHLAAA